MDRDLALLKTQDAALKAKGVATSTSSDLFLGTRMVRYLTSTSRSI